jgi:hypothetical protein
MWQFTLKRAIENKIHEHSYLNEKQQHHTVVDDIGDVAKKAAGGFMLGIGKIKGLMGKQEA